MTLLILIDVHTHTFEQASVITDVVVLYVMRGRHFYREKKYDHAIDPEKTYKLQELEQSSSPNSSDEDIVAV